MSIKTWKRAADGIWKNKSGTYYERPKIDGRWTYRSLKTKRLTDAKDEFHRRRRGGGNGQNPIPAPAPAPAPVSVPVAVAPVASATQPSQPVVTLAVSDVIRRYQADSYNLLWLWFLDREFHEGSFDHSISAKNYERVLSADVAKLFFAEIYDLSRQEGWTSDDHFTAHGTLIESWASLKSFVRKDGADTAKVKSAKDEDPGNPTLNLRGEKRGNDTHQSSTDPESVLYQKANGKEARLCFGGHVLMENRNGLCADFTLHNPIADPNR